MLLYFVLVAVLYLYLGAPKADDWLAAWQGVFANITVQSKEEGQPSDTAADHVEHDASAKEVEHHHHEDEEENVCIVLHKIDDTME